LIIPVILAGGSGSRLWPLSRSMQPKQLLPLLGKHTLLQDTVLRATDLAKATLTIAPPMIICNRDHHFLVEKQLHEIGSTEHLIILEPEGKNTAPAATLASLIAEKHYTKGACLLILPADHFIRQFDLFAEAVTAAAMAARQHKLVTFGITPTQPETGYGYIKAGAPLETMGFAVEQFVEKPDLATATAYIQSGEYYWNSGMFMFTASDFLQEMRNVAPDILATCEKALKNTFQIDDADFSACRSDSIDYAVMEKTKRAALVPLKAEWNDLGSFAALWEVHAADQHGNVTHGDVITESVQDSYLHAESRMLAVVGVSDHVIVETADAVLVAHRNHSQEVKAIVSQLKQKARPETVMHKKVHRQWGHYEVLNEGPGYQVKRLTVLPHASLSLQMHFHRSEHWVVVSGKAEVRCFDQIFTLSANESTYIPREAKHQLSNPFDDKLEVIEVQAGDYLGEDDIVRFTDQAGTDPSFCCK